LRDMIIHTAPPTIMTGRSTETGADTTATFLPPSGSPSSAPSSAPASLPTLEPNGNATAVIHPGMEEGGSAASSSSSVTPGQTVLRAIALVACVALTISQMDDSDNAVIFGVFWFGFGWFLGRIEMVTRKN
jgi:hypothetical protein